MTAALAVGSRSGRWWAERSALLAATGVMVVGASSIATSRIAFVAAAFACAGFVVLAWRRGDVTSREVLGVAVLLRLMAYPLLPGLSDDGYRYLWDGMLQAEGLNPYRSRPSEWANALDTALYPLLNSAEYYSVYPPASQIVFLLGGVAAAWGWPVGWYVLKAVFVAIELAGIWALSRMVDARLLVLYAWHPLVVIETAGQAHTEAGMVGALVLAIWAYRHKHPALSVASLTVSGWFKLYPLVLLPFLLRRVGWRYVWIPITLSLGLLLPYAHPDVLGNVAASIDLYVRSFEFNAGPYFTLKGLGYVVSGSDWSKQLGPSLRMVFLIGLAVVFVLDARYRWRFACSSFGVLGLLWATATTVHPWYLVSILALLPLVWSQTQSTPSRSHAAAWLWLSVFSLGTYLYYPHGEGIYWVFVWLGWGGWGLLMLQAFGACLVPRVMQRRAARKWRWMRPYIAPPTQVLDLGAGEGYVGSEIAQDTGATVTLVDVVDFNATALPFQVYDGRHLPFETDTFDLTVVVFVLHHAEDPEAILHEVRRVTRGRVLLAESVFESQWERRWLEVADRIANRVRSAGAMKSQEAHLAFRSAVDWRRAILAAGFSIEREASQGNGLHRQHLFVLTSY